MRRKTKIILFSYGAAALTVFGVFLHQGWKNLEAYRLAAKYSSGRAFEETVGAVEGLSASLEKSIYAVDSGMRAGILSEIYARALAAETAVSALPFATQELEQVSEFLNMTGDYAYSLCAKVSEQDFSEEEKESLEEMSETAADFAACLSAARKAVYDGSLIIDSREKKLQNIFGSEEARKLSEALLQYESEFRPVGEPVYDGRYGRVPEKASGGKLDEEEILSLAASYLGTEANKLKKEYEYQGTEGRCCYSAGDMLICTGPGGVESFSGSRLVGDIRISPEEAQRRAEEFLKKQGFERLALKERQLNGALMSFIYSKTQDDAVFLDNCLKLSVAMDDGSVYSFNAADYRPGESDARWKIDAASAAEKLPESLKCAESRKVVRRSPGGKELPCWELACVNEKGRGVRIYVDAESGKQYGIELENRRD